MGARAVFLVGFMASGKTSVGQELSRRLGWEFIDLDTRIEARERMTVPEIFQAKGESGFRLAETAALRDLTESLDQDRVVALGGGAFAQQENLDLLRPWHSVFLETPLDELWRRSLQDGIERPLRRSREQFSELHAQRLPFYRQATLTVTTEGKDVASICAEIEGALLLTSAGSETGGAH